MARREITQYFDDLDNSLLAEQDLQVIRFSLDGTDYILDLSTENAREFRATLDPFLRRARQAPATPYGRGPRGRANPREIRRWAQSQGLAIAHRGKIPYDIVNAYNEAHAEGL